MRRRLDLAAALVAHPPVLFLDEPTTGLDPRSRLDLWETIEGLVADGTTVLLTTQYLDEADRLADRIAVIDRGRVIADGTADELKERVGGLRLEVHVTDRTAATMAAEALAPMSEEAPQIEDAKVSVRVRQETGTIMEAARRLDEAGIDADDVARPPADARRRVPDPDRPRGSRPRRTRAAERARRWRHDALRSRHSRPRRAQPRPAAPRRPTC